MKAWVLRAPAPIESYPLELTDIPTPVPADDEILVGVAACGICRADLHVVEGEGPRLYATNARNLAIPRGLTSRAAGSKRLIGASDTDPLSTKKSFAIRGLVFLIADTPVQTFPENLRKSPQLAK